MSQILNEVLQANQTYAANFGDKGNLPMPPGRPKHRGDIIPFVRIQLEIGNVPVALKIKQCTHPQCNRLFLSAGSNHRKCHHGHKHPIDKLY